MSLFERRGDRVFYCSGWRAAAAPVQQVGNYGGFSVDYACQCLFRLCFCFYLLLLGWLVKLVLNK